MDYKDLVVIGMTILGGLVGSSLGPLGGLAGILVGAGIGSTWANYTDHIEHTCFDKN